MLDKYKDGGHLGNYISDYGFFFYQIHEIMKLASGLPQQLIIRLFSFNHVDF